MSAAQARPRVIDEHSGDLHLAGRASNKPARNSALASWFRLLSVRGWSAVPARQPDGLHDRRKIVQAMQHDGQPDRAGCDSADSRTTRRARTLRRRRTSHIADAARSRPPTTGRSRRGPQSGLRPAAIEKAAREQLFRDRRGDAEGEDQSHSTPSARADFRTSTMKLGVDFAPGRLATSAPSRHEDHERRRCRKRNSSTWSSAAPDSRQTACA